MCGIIGIITKKDRNLIPDIAASLSDLEYRGYDSAGLAFLDGGVIRVHKCVGAPSQNLNPEEIKKNFGPRDISAKVAIGHNRWATHGEPSVINAHPHLDCRGAVAVVHNGTILNYAKLKEELVGKGHAFSSETDTEVIPHLIEDCLAEGLSLGKSVAKTCRRLEGSFGLAAVSGASPELLVVAKNGSPLVIGVLNESLVVASSQNAIIRYTDRIISLHDGEMAELSAAGELVYSISKFGDAFSAKVSRQEEKIIGISIEDVSKGEFETFMLKEIFDEPASVRATLLGRYDKNRGDAVLGGLIDYNDYLALISHIYFVACGTAHNAACVGKEIIESLTDIIVESAVASEFRYRKHNFPKTKTAVFAVSQSGETADTLESVKEAGRKGYKTFGIVNVVGSAIAETTDAGIYNRAGIEIGVASTKAFTSQLAAVYLLALKLARARGMSSQKGKEYIREIERLPELMKKTLEMSAEPIRKITGLYGGIKTINFLGRGIHVPVSAEGALKFKELTYIEAGSYPLGELKHGPMAVIDKESLSVVLSPKDELFDISKNSIEQIKSKGGKILLITSEDSREDSGISKADSVLYLPTLKEKLFYPMLEIIPLQLFAYHFAKNLGRNIDKPRNLAKSVTVE